MYCTSSSNMFYFLLITFFCPSLLCGLYLCKYKCKQVSWKSFLYHLKNKLSRRRKEMLGGGDLFSALSH